MFQHAKLYILYICLIKQRCSRMVISDRMSVLEVLSVYIIKISGAINVFGSH